MKNSPAASGHILVCRDNAKPAARDIPATTPFDDEGLPTEEAEVIDGWLRTTRKVATYRAVHRSAFSVTRKPRAGARPVRS
jgi:hypothetical protein